MRTDADTHRKDLLFQTIQNRFRQTEFRDSVTCDTADLVLLLKDRHLIPMLCQNDQPPSVLPNLPRSLPPVFSFLLESEVFIRSR